MLTWLLTGLGIATLLIVKLIHSAEVDDKARKAKRPRSSE
jgi:hypothetical protein